MFQPGDEVFVKVGSALMQKKNIAAATVFVVVECVPTIHRTHRPSPTCDNVVRVKQAGQPLDVITPALLPLLEFFAADEFRLVR